MNKIKKYKKYIILGIGLLVTVLLMIALLYLNKKVFTQDYFKAVENYSKIKLTANNLIGFSAIIVTFSTFVLFVVEDSNKED